MNIVILHDEFTYSSREVCAKVNFYKGRPVTISLHNRQNEEAIIALPKGFSRKHRPTKEHCYFDCSIRRRNGKVISIDFRYRRPHQVTQAEMARIERKIERQIKGIEF